MRVQKLALAVGLVSALGGNGALALGLGEIKLNSTLNQPLNAEIKLLQTRGLGDSEIKVRLASEEDFDRAGVDRAYLLSELRFEVDYSGNAPVIRISSRAPIREPFLNFLVETRWPSGRLLREYTLLMDLPAFSTNTASQPVRAAERERQQVRRDPTVQQPLKPTVQRAPEPVQAPAEEAAPAPVEQTPVQPEPQVQDPAEIFNESEFETPADTGSRVYGPVEANKTLWEIARDSRESREVSVQQTMLAIQRLNPEAFINNNINLLKKGAVLRLPTTDEVRTLSRTDAVSEVATQNDAWRERVGDSALGAPLDGRAAAEETVESESVEGRVSLAAPGDNESVISGSGSGASDSEALEGELAVTEEELDKSQLENAELQERIGELNEQIDTMEQLVDVSNEELRAVQDAAAQADEMSETSALNDSAEFSEEEVSDESPLETEEVAPVGEAEQVEEPEVTAEEQAEADDARNRVVVVQTKSEPTLVERLMDNIQLIGAGAGVLLVGIFGFITWRRRKEEEEAIRQVEAEMAAARAAADSDENTDELDHLSAVEELEADSSFDLDQLGEVETGDPVAEAEIHLSLGQYPEAESKLLAGLGTAPGNIDARLMLLEVYAQQQNAASFDDHYRQLLSYSDGPAADRAARLRETIADAGPFEAPENDFSSESLEAAQLDDMGADLDGGLDDDFDVSASFDDLEEFSGADKTVVAGEGSQGDEDLALLDDLNLELGSDDAVSAGSAEAESDEFSLDLDLGDDLDLGGELDLDSAPESAGQGADAGDGDDFNLDDLMAGGELDLDGLDLDSDFSAESGEPIANAEANEEEQGGLEFDLDLSPMDDADELSLDSGDTDTGIDAEPSVDAGQSAELSFDDDELDSFGGDFDGLDLDSIDLGDLDLGEDLEPQTDVAVEAAPARDVAQVTAPAQPAAQQDGESFEDLGFDLEGDLDSELNLLEGGDEVSTKLELAQAYLEMGDKDGAREILGEVVEEAAGEQQQRAKELLERMS
ncbi:FimV/HubP family polar landmark protein [Microbulbifer aggregans]|uniref:FimV/HubP family polar landmark protein n=1 Tax=Microbulbifer aggregans TaxID=1769779 RepID=UPI001CFEB976|nr:FimV/HubP family polar landmark protein [Microbulbifer aggregans]